MILAYTGQPGNGKTLYAVSQIIDALVHTERFICTNIPLKLDVLNAYIQKKYPNASVNISERIMLLTEPSDIFYFYRFRSGGVLPEIQIEKGVHPTELIERAKSYFSLINQHTTQAGCLYIIDEAHDIYNARNWQTSSSLSLYYFTKHRHLGDDVILITQHLPQLDKQLRNLISKFYVLVNYNTRNLGIFKLPGKFVARVYFDNPSPTLPPAEKISFRLDAAGVASCYETCGALGVNTTDQKTLSTKRSGKLPFWSMYVFLGCLALVFILFLFNAPRLASSFLSSRSSKKVSQTQSVMRANSPSQSSQNYYDSISLRGDILYARINGITKILPAENFIVANGEYFVFIDGVQYSRRPQLVESETDTKPRKFF